MTEPVQVLSVYEGFFSGGARKLHSSVIIGLHRGGQQHSVLSVHREMRRENIRQAMTDDACYRAVAAAGLPVQSLRRGADGGRRTSLSRAELATVTRAAERADVVLALKEQPLWLVNHPAFPRKPVIACLHRSDPENQGGGLAHLREAVEQGRIAACICCAESTRAAYERAGIPAELLHTIPNGVDLARFRPVSPAARARLRRSLGVAGATTVVVFAARYHDMKNVPLFLRAARAYLERETGGHVLVCGAGMTADNHDLRRDIREAFGGGQALAERVHLMGIRHDMEKIYAAADVVSLTSSVGEAAPLCLIEGSLCGAVPVATDIGDCATIVADRGLITRADPDAIAAAWREAVDRRTEFARAISLGRATFSHSRMVAAYAALIDRTHRASAARPSTAVAV